MSIQLHITHISTKQTTIHIAVAGSSKHQNAGMSSFQMNTMFSKN